MAENRIESGYLLSTQEQCRGYDVGVDHQQALALSEMTPINDVRKGTRQHTLENGGLVNGKQTTTPQYLYAGGPLAYDATKFKATSQPHEGNSTENNEKKERLAKEISRRIIESLHARFQQLDENIIPGPESETGYITDIVTLSDEDLKEMGLGIDINYRLDVNETLSDEQRETAANRMKFVKDVFNKVNKIVRDNCFTNAPNLFLIYSVPCVTDDGRVIIRLYDDRESIYSNSFIDYLELGRDHLNNP